MATYASPRKVLALMVLTCVLTSMLGLETFVFGGGADGHSQVLKLLWIGPLLALPVLGVIAICRKVLVPAALALFLVNYLGSLVLMNGECASGGCIPTHNPLLQFAQVVFGSLCTPQSGLSITLAALAFLYQRSGRCRVSIQ
jgi:hypothetical protein